MKQNIAEENNELQLVIGEKIPENCPETFNRVALYISDENGNLSFWDTILFSQSLNHARAEVMDEDNINYYFYEGYDVTTKAHEQQYLLITKGPMMGVYRLSGVGDLTKIKEMNSQVKVNNATRIREQNKHNL